MSKQMVKRAADKPEKGGQVQARFMLDGKPLQIGDLLIDKDGRYYRVERFGHAYKRKDPAVFLREWDGEKWGHESSGQREEEWNHYHKYTRLPGTIEDAEAEALKVIADPGALEPEAENTDEKALVAAGSKAHVLQMEAMVEERRQLVARVQAVMNRKLNHLNSIAYAMQDQLRTIRKVIGVIELYLGVNEEIVQIREGFPALPNTPVSLRQQVLFMDEECGDPRGGGIDFTRVEDFDAWLTGDAAHLQQVLPEERGVVAIRPSRQERTYSDNPWIQADCEAQNHMVYLLIRNGEQVFRIWTGTNMKERLFPAMDELEKMFASDDHFRRRDAEGTEFDYKRNLLLLQGLLDRTAVFQPLAVAIELAKPDTYGNLVRFIRDDEAALTEGRESYKAWRAKGMEKVTRGSRIFVGPFKRYEYGDYHWNRRFLMNYAHDASCPPLPKSGVYRVEEVVEKEVSWRDRPVKTFRILYNPGDTIYDNSWSYHYEEPHERKNKLSFLVYPEADLVLNYDLMLLEDVEFYIGSRLERKHYLDIIPILWGIREARQTEIEWERHFVGLVAGRLNCSEKRVWEAINWWKFKNKLKRPLTSDESKALRMIEKRITKQLTGEEVGDDNQNEQD